MPDKSHKPAVLLVKLSAIGDIVMASGLPSNIGRRRFSGQPEQILQDIQTYADVGVTHTIFDIRSSDLNQTTDRMAWFAEEIIAKG